MSSCKILKIKKKYCTIELIGYDLDNIEVSKLFGTKKGVCIENLDQKLPCMKKGV